LHCLHCLHDLHGLHGLHCLHCLHGLGSGRFRIQFFIFIMNKNKLMAYT